MIQIISIKGPGSDVDSVTKFFQALKKVVKDFGSELVGLSLTMPDIFGYVTLLMQVTDNEDEIGKAICNALQPAKWMTAHHERVIGYTYKACNRKDIPIHL